jgi:deazaflavin-dependent oxidoreductase (nitroreductase family)
MSTAEQQAQERRDRDEAMMAEARANGGVLKDGMALVIMHTIGAVSGKVHVKPVCVAPDGDDIIVAATAGGQKRHPQWYRNLMAHPDITVEYMGETFDVTASTVTNGPDRDRLFARMVVEIPGAYGYQDRCREYRQIPVVRMVRR